MGIFFDGVGINTLLATEADLPHIGKILHGVANVLIIL